MDPQKIFQSKIFKKVLGGIGIAALALLVFQAGILVGYRKAVFGYRWGENYHRNFGGPREGLFGHMRELGANDLMNSHGTFGKIIKIELPHITVEGENKTEKIILVNNTVTIRKFRDTVTPADLKINDYIVVIGEPNDAGQVEAKLIRVLPAAPSFIPHMKNYQRDS